MPAMTTTLFDTFVHSLRTAMEKNGISQQELARRSGIHFVTINRLLKGKLENTTFELAEKLLAAADAETTRLRKKIS